jgi:hypothetical protein
MNLLDTKKKFLFKIIIRASKYQTLNINLYSVNFLHQLYYKIPSHISIEWAVNDRCGCGHHNIVLS